MCHGSLQGRDTVLAGGQVVYGGQAILNRTCAGGCHSSSATGDNRHGVPAGLDFDLMPVDQEDVAGTKKSGDRTVVKLTGSQIAGLRARQKKIVEQRNLIWQQIEDGLMPPSGGFESMMTNIFASSEKTPCKRGTPYTEMSQVRTREVLRNWLACGAPLVETNSTKIVPTVATPGTAGYQYRVCEPETEVITLETLFSNTLSQCGGCHNQPIGTPPPRFTSLEVFATTLLEGKGCSGKPFVTPYKPEESYLLDRLKGADPDCPLSTIMPPGDMLTERGIAQVTAWITAGAPVTADDVKGPNQSVDESTDDESTDADDEASDDEPTDTDDEATDDQATDEDPVPTKDAGAARDAGKLQDAGSAKDAGTAKDAGKDAGRDAGR